MKFNHFWRMPNDHFLVIIIFISLLQKVSWSSTEINNTETNYENDIQNGPLKDLNRKNDKQVEESKLQKRALPQIPQKQIELKKAREEFLYQEKKYRDKLNVFSSIIGDTLTSKEPKNLSKEEKRLYRESVLPLLQGLNENINKITNASEKIFGKLEIHQLNSQTLLQDKKQFNNYFQPIQEVIKTSVLLNKIFKMSPKIKNHLDTMNRNNPADRSKETIDSFLMRPIQRGMQSELNLKEIQKNCENERCHVDQLIDFYKENNQTNNNSTGTSELENLVQYLPQISLCNSGKGLCQGDIPVMEVANIIDVLLKLKPDPRTQDKNKNKNKNNDKNQDPVLSASHELHCSFLQLVNECQIKIKTKLLTKIKKNLHQKCDKQKYNDLGARSYFHSVVEMEKFNQVVGAAPILAEIDYLDNDLEKSNNFYAHGLLAKNLEKEYKFLIDKFEKLQTNDWSKVKMEKRFFEDLNDFIHMQRVYSRIQEEVQQSNRLKNNYQNELNNLRPFYLKSEALLDDIKKFIKKNWKEENYQATLPYWSVDKYAGNTILDLAKDHLGLNAFNKFAQLIDQIKTGETASNSSSTPVNLPEKNSETLPAATATLPAPAPAPAPSPVSQDSQPSLLDEIKQGKKLRPAGEYQPNSNNPQIKKPAKDMTTIMNESFDRFQQRANDTGSDQKNNQNDNTNDINNNDEWDD